VRRPDGFRIAALGLLRSPIRAARGAMVRLLSTIIEAHEQEALDAERGCCQIGRRRWGPIRGSSR
jgi:hypothetical protein